jgi:hypothetical protein
LFKASRSLALACVAAFALAACGGGGGTSSTSPVVPKNSAGGQKKVQSVPCTPDSYGYCYVQTYHNTVKTMCAPRDYIFNTTNTYEVYNATDDLGSYTEYLTDNCTHDPMINWEPGEPSAVYGDPNLP